MKRMILFPVVIAMILSLSGCYLHQEMYEQEDADRIAAEGAGMMQGWLDENMPDAKLEECTAFVAWTRYDGNDYLTDYASGQIRHNGEMKSFTIHTVTGAVYFEMDADTRHKLEEIAEDYFDEALEAIGISPESVEDGYAFECYVMAPAKDDDSVTEVPWVYSFDFGLPAGVEDLNAFVRNPQSRLPIYVSTPEITVSDTTDLSAYDLAALERLEDEYGLHIGSMSVSNSDQYFQKGNRWDETHTSLWEYGYWLEEDGFNLRGRVHAREEVRSRETGELTVSDQKVNPETDLVFEQTDYGYRLSLRNKDLEDSLRLQAYEGAEILEYDYYCLDEDDYRSEQDLSEKGIETFWRKLEDGSCVLAKSSDQSTLRLYDGDILVQKE